MTIRLFTFRLARNIAAKDCLRLAAGTALALAACAADAAPISLSAPLPDWHTVVQSNQFDPTDDQRGLFRTNLDLVGDATHPLLATLYDDNGTPDDASDDEFGLRVRLGGANANNSFEGIFWLGVDADIDGDIDALLSVQGNGAAGDQFAGEIAVYATASGASNSPLTTAPAGQTLLEGILGGSDAPIEGLLDGRNFLFVPVDNSSDPEAMDTDLNNNGVPDYWVSVKMSWASLADALNATPLTGEAGNLIGSINGGDGLTPTTPVRWVVSTSANGNAQAGDAGGYHDRSDNLATTYEAQDAFLESLSFSNLFPEIISGLGAPELTVTVRERSTLATQVQAIDPNGDTLSYEITGGADAEMFEIDSTSGVVSFRDLPRFSDPEDANGDNLYQLLVAANDGQGGEDTQAISVRVQALGVQPSVAASVLEADAASLTADGKASTKVTVVVRTADGEAFGLGGDDVTLQASAGTLSAVTDRGDGTYTATYTAGTTTETVIINAMLNGMSLADDLQIGLTAAAADPTQTEITLADAELVADASSSTVVTVQLMDANMNPVTSGDDVVQLKADLGQISAVETAADGSYSAVYTSPVQLDSTSATATISATVNGRAAGSANLLLTYEPPAAPTPTEPGGSDGGETPAPGEEEPVPGEEPVPVEVKPVPGNEEPAPAEPAPGAEQPTPGDSENPAKPGADQAQPQVKTAVRGAGGMDGAWLLGALLLILVVRFGRQALGRRTIAGVALMTLPLVGNAHFHDCEPDERFNFEEVHCWYGGISVGQSMLEPEIEGDVWSLSENGDTAMGLLAGYQILPHWFGEIAFYDLGEAVFESDSSATNPAIGYRVPSLMVGYNLANPSSHWNVFAKAGVARIMNAADENEIDFEAGSSAQFAIGGGVQFSFNPHWHLRLEVNSYDKDATTYGLTFIRRGGFLKLSDVLY